MPHYLVEVQLVATLGGIAPALGVERQATLLERILNLEPIKDNQLLAQGWGRVLTSLRRARPGICRAPPQRARQARDTSRNWARCCSAAPHAAAIPRPVRN